MRDLPDITISTAELITELKLFFALHQIIVLLKNGVNVKIDETVVESKSIVVTSSMDMFVTG